ncbi:MAG: OB-fold nucleic acid binding domain-containing protein [Candidatus Thorarchaeota archaeon]
MTAIRASIADIIKGEYSSDDGHKVISPFGIELKRVMIVGHIVGQYTGKDNFASITIDDGTETIQAKVWDQSVPLLQKLEEGVLAVVVGKIREYNEEVYLVPEIVRPLSDPNFLTLHQLGRYYHLLKNGSAQSTDSQTLEDHFDDAASPTPETPETTEPPSGLNGRILKFIKENDTSEGVQLGDIADHFAEQGVEKSDINIIVMDLVETGMIYEQRVGVYRCAN